MVKKSKSSVLEQIAADIRESNICPDLAASATNLVMGDGNPDSDIVFIGEAPGKNEDLKARPFVGAAGKFLEEMLELEGMKRSDVYITNIVKYRPKNNRDPLDSEKKDFWPYLMKEIGVIKPLIIATLGRHSMEYFLPTQRISQIHGQPKRITLAGKKIVVLPLFHPAAALYNSNLRTTLMEDFKNLNRTLQLIKNKEEGHIDEQETT